MGVFAKKTFASLLFYRKITLTKTKFGFISVDFKKSSGHPGSYWAEF
jgi:hypothetical protein